MLLVMTAAENSLANSYSQLFNLLSKKLNCYRITLEYLPQNVGFYKKFRYTVSEQNYVPEIFKLRCFQEN